MAAPTAGNSEAPRGFAGLATLVSVLPDTQRTQGTRAQGTPAQAAETPREEVRARPAAADLPPARGDPIWIRKPAVFWLVVVGIGVIVYLGNAASNDPKTPPGPTHPPATTYVTPQPQPYVPPPLAPVALPSLTEVKPTAGANLVLSASEIVYCLSESARLEAMRGIVDDTSQLQVNNFNARISDFNARCSNYRYRTSDMERAKITVDSRMMSILQAEAARTVAGWR